MSSATPEWGTPQDLFDELDAEFGFDLDVCATAELAKCERFFSPDDDGLAQEWTGVCWMNPPYGDVIPDWIEKAHTSGESGATVVCLVPARVDTGWWWEHCRYGEIRCRRDARTEGGAMSDTSEPIRFAGRAEFAEVAEALGIPTTDITAVFPEEGGLAAVYTEGASYVHQVLARRRDGILARAGSPAPVPPRTVALIKERQAAEVEGEFRDRQREALDEAWSVLGGEDEAGEEA